MTQPGDWIAFTSAPSPRPAARSTHSRRRRLMLAAAPAVELEPLPQRAGMSALALRVPGLKIELRTLRTISSRAVISRD